MAPLRQTIGSNQPSRRAAIQEIITIGRSATCGNGPTIPRDLVLSYYTLQTATRFQCNLRAVDSRHLL